MPIKTLVWGENVHERTNKTVQQIYPKGMHKAVAKLLSSDEELSVSTVTLQDEEHGLTERRLKSTDVLIWWGHAAHGEVKDEIVERVARRVWAGMGLIVLHSGHFSKIFQKLMGAPCALYWREAGERERIWTVNPGHPIARGVPEHFELENEEMYGEPFSIPEPLETVFISWFQGGEVFRSGATWRRGRGNIFYFRPGHETYPTYHNPVVGQVLRNAVHWAYNPVKPIRDDVTAAPNWPVDKALERIEERGGKLHKPGDKGLR